MDEGILALEVFLPLKRDIKSDCIGNLDDSVPCIIPVLCINDLSMYKL